MWEKKLDLAVIKKEVNAFEEMGRQLFLEIVDLNRTVTYKLKTTFIKNIILICLT